jgi:lactoylglutathione lyase
MSNAAASSEPVRIDGLFETHLTVADLDRSVAFYRDVLGMPLAYTVPERGVAFFWLGGPGKGMLGLWKAGTVLRMHLHLALTASLDEVLAAPAKLRASGVTPRGFGGEASDEPVVHCWMPAAAVFFADPDGHSLEYLAMLPDEPRPDLGVLGWAAWQARDAG